jgi:thiol-disulfide isomerase/thioredoxin
MKKIKFFWGLIFLINITSVSCAQGYRIELKVDGLRDSTLQLGFYFGEKTLLADTARVNSKGVAIFKGDSLLHRGMYFIVLPGSYFEILVGSNQNFSVSTTLENKIENITFKNSPENTEFTNYRKFMNQMQKQMGELQKKAQAQKEVGKVEDELLEQMTVLDKEVKNYWDNMVKKNPNTFLATIIKSLTQVEIPEFDIPENEPKPDSLRWIKGVRYNQKHYFDNINFSEAGLIRTPYFHGFIDNYFDRVVIPIPDTVSYYADKIISKSRSNPDMFKFIATHLFSKFSNSSIMGMDAVFVHIAEKYYLSGEAKWVNQENFGKITKRVADLKPNLIGQIAPNFKMLDANNTVQELHKIKADVTIVYFWEPGCSFCKKETPILHEVYKKFKSKGLAVIAVCTQNQEDKWKEYITTNSLSWINVWDPTRATRYDKLYDIYSTPVIYVLDKNKKIVAKRIGAETVERFIEQELKIGSNKK